MNASVKSLGSQQSNQVSEKTKYKKKKKWEQTKKNSNIIAFELNTNKISNNSPKKK